MGSVEDIGKPRFVTLDQLVTISDLQAFKTDFLLSIKDTFYRGFYRFTVFRVGRTGNAES
jgi:hypothetical protein